MSQFQDESTEPQTRVRQPDEIVRSQSHLWSKVPKDWHPLLSAIAMGGVVALGVIGIRQVGLLQGTELRQYDQFVQLQPKELPDSRILVVGVTEEDITQYRWPLSDQIIDQTIAKLEAFKPRAIGLDIFRDLPIEPGHATLQKRFQTSDVVIPVCKIGDATSPGVAPPPNVPLDYVGFADNVTDPDGVVRRSLLYTSPSDGRCQATNSLALQLAISYLAAQNIQPTQTAEGYPQLGNAVFKPISNSAGGYRHVDVRGYQTFLHYRAEQQAIQTVTLNDVLENKLKADYVSDRVVLIGYVASSIKDVFLTPYNTGKVDQQLMPGVVLHAQNVSQILSTVLDGRPLLGYWPEWAEAIWIIGWALIGSVLSKRLENPTILAFAGLVAVVSLCGWGFLLFLQGHWVPIVPAAISLTFAGLGGFCYDAYRLQQQQRQVAKRVQEQDKAIALLQNLLKETQATAAQPTRPAPTPMTLVESPELTPSTLIGGRYRMQKVLGAGGFGQTFLAADIKRPGEPVCVVKWLRPARQDEKFMAVARRLFSSEADILERLGQHNRIPQLLAYFEEHNDFYLVQDYIAGKSLGDELRPGKPLSEAQAMEIVRGILEVLVFVHHHQVIHRDIKPANLIRRESDKRLVLIDFGAVKQMQPGRQEVETKTVVIGTPGYAPAEQLAGQPSLSSDVYATGVIGIQALTGMHPTQLDRDKDTGELIWRDKAQVSPGFADVLDKMVRYFFGNRYPTAIAALRDIEKLPR